MSEGAESIATRAEHADPDVLLDVLYEIMAEGPEAGSELELLAGV